MDQGTLVVNRIDEGRRFVERLAADGNPIQAAFWAEVSETSGLSFLYLVTDLYDREGPAASYRAVQKSLQKLGEVSLKSSRIKAIGPSNPIARDVLKIMERHPGREAITLEGKRLGFLDVERAYIYPSHTFSMNTPDPMTTEEIGQQLIRLMNRGTGLVHPSRVTLKDGVSFHGVPFSIQYGSQNELVVQFLAEKEAAPRVYRIDEIASIV